MKGEETLASRIFFSARMWGTAFLPAMNDFLSTFTANRSPVLIFRAR